MTEIRDSILAGRSYIHLSDDQLRELLLGKDMENTQKLVDIEYDNWIESTIGQPTVIKRKAGRPTPRGQVRVPVAPIDSAHSVQVPNTADQVTRHTQSSRRNCNRFMRNRIEGFGDVDESNVQVFGSRCAIFYNTSQDPDVIIQAIALSERLLSHPQRQALLHSSGQNPMEDSGHYA